ncbi:MAG: response regulator [Eubacteriales bacterium]
MFKVLLVDDEIRITEYLEKQIPWKRLSFEVVQVAQDGLSAMEYLRENVVDLVITDIKMPKLSGLELCREIKGMNSSICMIIISSYADFSYAKEAMKVGALGYCLKPIEYDELVGLLRSVSKKLSIRIKLDYNDFIDGIEEENTEVIYRFLEENALHSRGCYLAISDHIPEEVEMVETAVRIKLSKYKYLYFCNEPFEQVEIEECIATIQDVVGVGIYPKLVEVKDLKKAIDETLIMSYQYFITGRSTICNEWIENQITTKFMDELMSHLESTDSLQEFIYQLLDSNYTEVLNINTVFMLINRIYFSNLIDSDFYVDAYLFGYEQIIGNYNDLQELLDELVEYISKMSGCIEEEVEEEQYSVTFLKIVKYLNEHYSEDISLKNIAKLFYLNANYLSQLFKLETGITYSHYITELRIGKAKELIQKTDFTLSEISDQIGFNDYFYFSKKFKKVVGVTPSSYQENYMNE